MDGKVPEYLGAGISRDGGSLRALDDYNFTHELLELLHHGDAGAGSSVVDEKTSLNLPEKEVAGDAEMASWLCEVFQQETSDPRIAATTTTTTTMTTKSVGEITIQGCSSGAGAGSGNRRVMSAGTPADDTPRSSGRRRSCSGKATEQRRRDKINDKMRTLQQLMPRCSKVLTANGYVMPTAATILPPPGVVPPSCMPLGAGDVVRGQAPAAPVMLPPYPFIPAVFACPHHGHGTSPPQYRYPAGSGSATQHLGQRRHPGDMAVASHR
ncbi:hypothetical protein ACQ4PT_038623 [Festuca glaucescens]